MGDVQQWADDYLKRFDIGAVNQSQSPVDIASQLISSGAFSDISNRLAPPTSPDVSGKPGFWGRIADVLSRPMFGVNNALATGVSNDPFGLAKNFAQSGGNSVVNTNVAQNVPNVAQQLGQGFNAVGRGLSGQDKTMPSDVVQKIFPDAFSGTNKVWNPLNTNPSYGAGVFTGESGKSTGDIAKGATNLGGLFVTDPLMLINPVAAVTGAKNLITGSKLATQGARAEEALQEAVRAGTTIPDPVIANLGNKGVNPGGSNYVENVNPGGSNYVAKNDYAATNVDKLLPDTLKEAVGPGTLAFAPAARSAADQWRITNGLLDPSATTVKSIEDTAQAAVAAGNRTIPPAKDALGAQIAQFFSPENINAGMKSLSDTLLENSAKTGTRLGKAAMADLPRMRADAARLGITISDDGVPSFIATTKTTQDTVTKITQNAATKAAAPGPKLYDNMAQSNAAQQLTKQAAIGLNGFDATRGTERIAAVNAKFEPLLKVQEDAQLAHGIVPAIKSSPESTTAYPVMFSNVLDSVKPFMTEPFHVSNSVRSARNMVAPSSLLAGAARSLDLHGAAIAADKAISDIAAHMVNADNRAGKNLVRPELINQVAAALYQATPALHDAAVINRTAIINKNVADTAHIFSTDSGWIEHALTSPTASQADAIHAIKDIGGGVEQTAKSVGATDEATKTAIAAVSQHAGQLGVRTTDVQAARTAVRTSNDLGSMGVAAKPKINSRSLVQAKANAEEGLAIARQVLSPGEIAALEDTLDIGLKTSIRITANAARGLKTWWTRVADPNAPASLTAAIRSGNSVMQDEGREFSSLITKLDKLPEAASMEGWSAARAGLTSATEDGAAAQQLWTKAINSVFDISRGKDASSSLLGVIWRNSNGDVHLLNDMLGTKGVNFRFNLEDAQKEYDTLKAAGKLAPNQSVFSTMADQWKKWDIKDPAAFMNKAYFGTQNLITHRAVTLDFASQFGSTTYKPGMVKIVDSNTKSILGKYMPQDVWFTKEAAAEFARNEQMLHIATSYRGSKGPLSSMINDFYDPLMAMWKPTMTILRPGHLIRNALGDIMGSMMDGVRTLRPYTIAMNSMKSVGRFGGDLAKLQELNKGKDIVGGTHALTATYKGGKEVAYSHERLYQLASQHGLFLNYHTSEDLLSPTGSGIFNKLGDLLVENKWMHGLGTANETVSNGGKFAHMISLMDRKSFTGAFANEHDMALAAVARVKRFHPDPMGLSPTEQRIMRRLVPFYSWARQALPMVMETMVTHPARIMALPKVTYGILQASGVDPKSLTDQFPADKLYPAFVRDNITGPMNLPGMGSTTMDFGSPVEGILGPSLLNSSAGVGKSVLGMLSPVLKAPVDLITQTDMGTGAHIADRGQYVDSLLPYVNQFANISGVSPSGTLANLTTGNYAGVPDPQRAVQKGEKEAFLNTSSLNFLLGLSSQQVNKPSYQKLAIKGL